MANSFGPSGAGSDPGKIFKDAIPKEVISSIKESASKIRGSLDNFAKGMAAASAKIKEESVERQYNLLEQIREEKQYRKDFAAWMKQELKDELQYKKDFAALMKQEANDELQYKKDIAKLINDQAQYEIDFYNLVVKEKDDLAREERRVEEERIRKLREDIQARAAAEDAAFKERAGVISALVSLENQKAREIEQAQKEALAAQRDSLAAMISLENQKAREIQKAKDDEFNELKKRIASAVSLEKQRLDEIKKADEEKKEQQKKDLAAVPEFVNSIKSAFSGIVNAIGNASRFVMAINPGLVAQLAFAMKDLYATIGLALQPVIVGATDAVRTFADFLVPVSRELQPIISELVAAFQEVFVGLFPLFRDLFSVFEVFIQVGTYLVKGFSYIMQPLIWWLEGYALVLVARAIPAIISFSTAASTGAALMTGGLSLLVGGIASAVLGIGRTTGALKDFEFKPGASIGMGARQASYAGITEFGKNLLSQSLGAGSANAAADTANNTKRCADLLEQINNKAGGGGVVQKGGDGVNKVVIGGREFKGGVAEAFDIAFGKGLGG